MRNKSEDPSILVYCAKSLKPNLLNLSKSAQRLLNRSNIEDVHDIRVASRRISAVLDSFSDFLPGKKAKSWKKEIGSITKSFGKVRDIDVQLDWIKEILTKTDDKKLHAGIRRIKLRLDQKRRERQDHTTETTASLMGSATIQEITQWVDTILASGDENIQFSPSLYQLGYKQIQNRLDEFLFYEVFIFDTQRVEELHAMRICAKKLRYALEVFSDLYLQETDFAQNITRQAQDYLGEIHDCDVWIDYLPKFMEKEFIRIKEFYGYTRPYSRIRPGIEYLILNRQEERQRLYRDFLKDWKEWKLKETWLNLRKVIFLTSLEMQSQQSLSPSISFHEMPIEEETPDGHENDAQDPDTQVDLNS